MRYGKQCLGVSNPNMFSTKSKRLNRVLYLEDFEPEAKKILPRPIYGYISNAAETGQSHKNNLSAFEDYVFLPTALKDVSKRSAETELLGHTYSAPFGISPMGISALSTYRGDIVLASGAAKENIPMIVSGTSLIRLEDIIKVNPNAWFQAYLPGDEANIDALIKRVADANFKTLVLTADTCVLGSRENHVKSGFSTPLRPSFRLLWDGITHPSWAIGTFMRTIACHGLPHFENSFAHRGAPIISKTVDRDFTYRDHLNWNHVERIRKSWKGHFVLKGILNVQDAKRAVEAGVDGIIVSNHGGRQMDGAISPLQVLADIVKACPSIPVMMDSGIRRGSDILKAFGLGAKFVFIGRPFGFASAVGGEDGVRHACNILKTEISRNMALLGVTSMNDIEFGKNVLKKS